MFEAMIQNKNQLHHTHDCVYVPDIHSGNPHCVINEKGEYLKKDNLLSEFDTDQKRAIAIENLGLSGAMRFKGEGDEVIYMALADRVEDEETEDGVEE